LVQEHNVSAENKIDWFVLKTIPVARVEFSVLTALHQLEYQAMLPFETKRVALPRNKGWDQVKHALFPRYVVVGLTDYRREFPYIKARINERVEREGKVPPVMGLIGTGREPGRLKTDEVARVRLWSMEEAVAVGLREGSQIDVVRGAWAGRSSRVDSFTKKGVRALMELFGGWHLVEIAMEDIRAA
jgi:transcription antitermination factor NusG